MSSSPARESQAVLGREEPWMPPANPENHSRPHCLSLTQVRRQRSGSRTPAVGGPAFQTPGSDPQPALGNSLAGIHDGEPRPRKNNPGVGTSKKTWVDIQEASRCIYTLPAWLQLRLVLQG